MWLVVLPRSQFSRVASATSTWSELPHNSRPLTFGTLLVPAICHTPSCRFPTSSFGYRLCGVPWISMIGALGLSFFSFWRILLLFPSFSSIPCVLTHPRKSFGNLCGLVGLVLRSCSRDLHVLHLTFVSIVLRGYGDDRHLLDSLSAGCSLSGPLFCRRKKGPGHSASLGTSLHLSSPHLLAFPSAIFISIYYPFIVISFLLDLLP